MKKSIRSYSEKLKDPRWQKKRLEVLELAGWKCEDCDSTTETIEIHHCYYETGKNPWEYEIDTLMAVCSSCHKTRQLYQSMLQRAVAKRYRKRHVAYLQGWVDGAFKLGIENLDEEALQGLLCVEVIA